MVLFFKRLYQWMLDLAGGKQAERWLAVMSFSCSIFFPIPQDAMLVPMCLAKPKKALRYALIATVASVCGGVVAYGLGYFFYEAVARPILVFYQAEAADILFKEYYARHGWLFVLMGGMTPLPYKVIALLSGYAGLFLPSFIMASLGGRLVRFFGIAIILYFFGERAKIFIDRYFGWLCWGLLILVVLGFIAVPYIL